MPIIRDTVTSTSPVALRPSTPDTGTGTDDSAAHLREPTAASPPRAGGRFRRTATRIDRLVITAIRHRQTPTPVQPARDIAARALRRTDEALLGLPVNDQTQPLLPANHATPGTQSPDIHR